MTCRLTFPLAALTVLLITAFSTGSAILLLPAVLIVLMIILGFLSVKLASRSLRIEARVTPAAVQRGDDASMQVTVSCRALLPVAPIRV